MEHGDLVRGAAASRQGREHLLERLAVRVRRRMDRQVAYGDALVGPPVHRDYIGKMFEKAEHRARLPDPRRGVVAGDDHHRYVRLRQPDQLLQREGQGAVGRPHGIEQVPAVQHRVGPQLEDAVHERLEREVRVHFPLVQPLELAILVAHPAIGGISQVRVRHVDDPHSNASGYVKQLSPGRRKGLGHLYCFLYSSSRSSNEQPC